MLNACSLSREIERKKGIVKCFFNKRRRFSIPLNFGGRIYIGLHPLRCLCSPRCPLSSHFSCTLIQRVGLEVNLRCDKVCISYFLLHLLPFILPHLCQRTTSHGRAISPQPREVQGQVGDEGQRSGLVVHSKYVRVYRKLFEADRGKLFF